MTLEEAKKIIGNRAPWELNNMIKALEMFGGFMNTPEESQRLQAAKIVRKSNRKTRR
jgi:hypothetical protein